jgi:putative transposase
MSTGIEAANNPGSTSVPGVGESVPLSQASQESPFRRDAETHARDGRAPQMGAEAAPLETVQSSGRIPCAEEAHYSKRRLPHFEKPWTIYAVTVTTRERRKLSPAARSIVLNALRHFHLDRYELSAACVMPDHVHFLFQPWPKKKDLEGRSIFWSIAELAHSLKSFTAHEINKLNDSSGAVWEEEVFDRYIRSESDLHEKFRYICRNPWESKVVRSDEEYAWVWTRESEWLDCKGDVNAKDPGSAPVPGAGESVPLSRSSERSSFRRAAETDARDGRAPRTAREAHALPRHAASPRSATIAASECREVKL